MKNDMKKYWLAIILLFISVLLNTNYTFAGVEGCVCYCGKILRPPCGDEACKQACGWREPSGSGSQVPAYDYETERQRRMEEERWRQEEEQRRQQEIEEQRKKDEEAAGLRKEEFERNKRDTLNSMKGTTEGELGLKGVGGDSLDLKEIGETGKSNLGLKEIGDKKVAKDKKAVDKRTKGWQKALSCAMEEVYSRAEKLGSNGASFAKDLRNEMTRVFNEAGQEVKDKDDVNIVNLKLDRQVSKGNASKERQFIVEIAVHSKGDGNVDVDVQSYFSETGKKNRQENIQSIIVLNKSGRVISGHKSAAVDACLAR